MTMKNTDHDTIAQLQSQLAFQEHELDKLHQALYEQQKRIDGLELQLKKLADKTRSLGDASAEMPADQKPPHY